MWKKLSLIILFNFATTWTFGVLPEKCTEDLNSNLRP